MNSLVVVLALLTGLALAAAGLSFVALYRVTAVSASAERRLAALGEQLASTAHATQQSLEKLSADFRDLEQQPALSLTPSPPRAGFNLGVGYVLSKDLPIDVRLQFSYLNLIGTGSGEPALMGLGLSAGYSFFL